MSPLYLGKWITFLRGERPKTKVVLVLGEPNKLKVSHMPLSIKVQWVFKQTINYNVF